MNIWSGHIGLTAAFTLIATVLLWLFIKSNIKFFIKALMVPLVLWYSLVLYHTPGKFMGWPSEGSIPKNSIVRSIIINEPKGKDQGGIYLWLSDMDKEKEEAKIDVNPKTVFVYNDKKTPRAYKLPYTRKMHKKLLNAQKEAEAQKGIMKIEKQQMKEIVDSKGQEEKRDEEAVSIEILNPQKLLTKAP